MKNSTISSLELLKKSAVTTIAGWCTGSLRGSPDAAREGGLLGFGGTRVSENEQSFLDALRNTLQLELPEEPRGRFQGCHASGSSTGPSLTPGPVNPFLFGTSFAKVDGRRLVRGGGECFHGFGSTTLPALRGPLERGGRLGSLL